MAENKEYENKRFEVCWSTAGFQPVDNVTSLYNSGKDQFYCFRKSEMVGPQLPLFRENSLPGDIVAEHYRYKEPPDVRLYMMGNGILGGGGLLVKDDALWLPPDCYPKYLGTTCEQAGGALPRIWTGALNLAEPNVVRTDTVCACPFHPNAVYGHFLLEMLPRLYLLAELRRSGAEMKVAIDRDAPNFLKYFSALYFGEDSLVWYRKQHDVVLSELFLVPSMLHVDHNFHPLFNAAVEDLRERAGVASLGTETGRWIYLSRTRVKAGWHKLANEPEVEAVFHDAGFEIVHPQELGLRDQLALYSRAECIAGQYSSAMHNSLFAGPGVKVLCLNRINWYQSMITRLRGQRLGFVAPADGMMRDWRLRSDETVEYTIDCQNLPGLISAFLAKQ